MNESTLTRKTSETDITVKFSLERTDGNNKIDTGIGFLNHMLNTLAIHGGFFLDIKCTGDTHVDNHHSAEDCGIVLGMAFAEAVGNKKGIKRYGTASIPMDEALGWCSLDISGRPFLVFEAGFSGDRTGEYENCLTEEFMRAFAFNAGITLHIKCLYGKNDHHKNEAMFKALAHALRQAVEPGNQGILSAKGVI